MEIVKGTIQNKIKSIVKHPTAINSIGSFL